MTHKNYLQALLLTLMTALCPMTISAQDYENETEEQRLDRIVSIYFVGNNDYEFYKAIGNLRNYVKNDQQKYFRTKNREIVYDLNHYYFNKALQKTEQLKDELIQAKAEDLYYLVDYLLGVFYGSRDENVLSQKYLIQASKAIKPGTNDRELLKIYQTLANVSISSAPEDDLDGYHWADQAIDLSITPRERCSSLSLKAMVAITHNDKNIFEQCYQEIINIRKENPKEELSMYWKYIKVGRHVFDGDFDDAVKACDSITPEVPRLSFLTHVYKLKGDTKAENEALYKYMRAKDRRNNEISTLTINDINQDILIDQHHLSSERFKLYTYLAITIIIALTILILVYLFLNRRRRYY